MVHYNFKAIATVPNAKEFVDVILSKTQRKTPTVVHPQYEIGRIRQFYMRKVKFTQQNYHDRFTLILDQFPILDDIHPFYADLMNVLYDRDHYKLALSQINTARHLVDNIAKDYVKLLKYADSLYRCKQLKRAALGRMATLVKKQASSLAYLEQVRQHLARLPSIDPNARTLILCGYPNVGKSSFLNKLTRADVEVQPYPFTTKSLFVGHTDYDYLTWQVIDTPGILDRPLEERNTIEMQSITALAHLRAAILYLVDLTESCGYTLKQQISLFDSIKPLFVNKPLILVINKIDARKLEELSLDDKKLLETLVSQGVEILKMSTFTDEGVADVKKTACERLLAQRVEVKMNNVKKMSEISNRLHVAVPSQIDPTRKPIIPASVLAAKSRGATLSGLQGKQESLDDDEQLEEGEDEEELPEWLQGFGDVSQKDRYLLKSDEWKYDVVPEIMDGHNIADWVDPDILEKLEELEREEQELMRLDEERKNSMEDDDDLTPAQLELLNRIREKKKLLRIEHDQRKARAVTSSRMPRKHEKEGLTFSKFGAHLKEMGIEDETVDRLRSKERSLSRGRKRERSSSKSVEIAASESRKSSSRSKTPFRKGEGYKDVEQKEKALYLATHSYDHLKKDAKKGVGDRVILNEMPKHLFSGKRKSGKTQRR